MKNKTKIIICFIFSIMCTFYIANADEPVLNYQNFDSIIKDIGRLDESASEQDKKTVRSNVFIARTFFQPEAEQAIKDMMNPDRTDGSGTDSTYFTGAAVSGFPEDLLNKSEFTREDIVRVALSALDVKAGEEGGQPIPYFWGGGHGDGRVKGFNTAKWFTKQLVTAADNDMTGLYRPYGSDCSGYSHWVYAQMPDAQYEKAKKLYATADSQFRSSREITKTELKPGDLGFVVGSGGNMTHVGIYIGLDPETKKRLFIHCGGSSYGFNLPKEKISGIGGLGYLYERGAVVISYLKSEYTGLYPGNIYGEETHNPPVNFTKFARVMEDLKDK